MLDAAQKSATASPLDLARCQFDDLNADLIETTISLLDSIVGDAGLHPKMMNTLSMLEHMGSRKIMATQQGAGIDEPTLRHLTEECHHAFFMKRQAEKAASREFHYGPDELLAPAGARMYFQRLEAKTLRQLPGRDSRTIYLYMSMIVEFRAIWFYSLYQQVLKQYTHPLSLKRLLGEEQNHLTEMAERLTHSGQFGDDDVAALIREERDLYGRLLNALHTAIN
jgi:hypothetical protein